MAAIKTGWVFVLIFNFTGVYSVKLDPRKEEKLSQKISNPGSIKDRLKDERVEKPIMPEKFEKRFQTLFHPAWMDYCDPYHCDDYHYMVCGLNRRNKKFKWFRSDCHLIVNNQCSRYRGFLKYDIVAKKYCYQYVMYLRLGCDTQCNREPVDPICAISLIEGNYVLFKHMCALEAANCLSGTIEEYQPVSMELCESRVKKEPHGIPVISQTYLDSQGNLENLEYEVIPPFSDGKNAADVVYFKDE